MRKMNKKGISQTIATILLIGFIITVVMLVIFWGKSYIEELADKKGALSKKQRDCTDIDLEIAKSCWRGKTAEITIKNKGTISVHKFIFRAVGVQGEGVELTGTLDGLGTKTYLPEFSTDVGKINSIDTIPYLRVALGHYVPCSKQKITTRLSGDC